MTDSKIADTLNPIHPLIKQRWSARAFTAKQVDQTELNTLFEAASWAASSMNEQPWKYLYAHQESESFNKMADCLSEGNQPWAQNGAVILISLAKKHFDRNGQLNRHAMHDVGAANTTMLLQAAQMDIYGHMMGGFDMDKALKVFNIDSNKWEIACFIVLGYLDDPKTLSEPYLTRELTKRARKPVDEFSIELNL